MKRVNKPDLIISYLSAVIWMIILAGGGAAQTTAFTYQGKLTDAGNLASGTYDMQFKLFDTAAVGTGTQQGTTLTNPTVPVTAGGFTVTLDFGANVFDGSARFLEISVRPAGNPNPRTILSPRQAINSAPYAIQTVNATQLGGLTAIRYVSSDTNGNVGIGTASPATKLDVVNSTSQLRFGPSTADNGGYLTSTNPSQAIIAGGAKWNGTNWIARDTAASLTANQSGVVQFLTNGNLTVGSPFNPTLRMHIDVSGNVGIGTSTPLTNLDVRGVLTLDPGASPTLFTSTAATEQNRYLHLANSPLAQSASGLKAGGILVADSYDYANPGKNDLIIKGNVGIGTSFPTQKLDVAGTTKTGVLEITGGADLAEHFETTDDAKPGMVVAIDPRRAGKLVLARGAYNRQVAGIISGANNLSAGMVLPDLHKNGNSMPVALSGRVWVYCDATKTAIKPGDLLTTSATPGHAMKVKNYSRAQGAVIGKAMTGLKSGKGLVLVLVTLQ